MMETSTRRRDRFERLFVEHYPTVLAYALRRAPRPLAEDAVSEAFLVAWRRVGDVPGDPVPWLLGVTRHTLANQHRSRARADALVSRLAETRVEDECCVDHEPGFSDGGLARALKTLSAHEREALLLVAWEGLSPQQAARVVGCSRTAFRLRLHRARKRFAAEFHSSQRTGPLEPHGTTPSPAQRSLT